MRKFLEKLISGAPPDEAEITDAFSKMFRNEIDDVTKAALLVALRSTGESGLILSAAARVMREHAVAPATPLATRPLADNCGTGGDGAGSFNISTAAALVAASAGVKVAKHGNRSVSSKCGSADLLFEAGFPADLSSVQTISLLEKTGLTFFFAPNFHPALKHIMPVRRSLGIRTVFNLLGPLANPIRPEFQIIGVGARDALRPMGEALSSLGVRRALIVHSRDGMDEISPEAITDALLIEEQKIVAMEINPKSFGVSSRAEGLAGGDAAFNLVLLNELLSGKTGAIADTVALNAGALLWICAKVPNMESGFKLAQDLLQKGAVRHFFSSWISTAKELSGQSFR